jgi:hypothetical protein
MDPFCVAALYGSSLCAAASFTAICLHRADENRLGERLPARRSALFWLSLTLISSFAHATLCAALAAFGSFGGAGLIMVGATLFQVGAVLHSLDAYGRHSLLASRLEKQDD